MKFQQFWILTGAVLVASSPAHAASTKTSASAKKPSIGVPANKLDGPQEITIPMSTGELQAEVQAEQAQRERANAPRTKLEFGASSWRPNSVVSASLINATPFKASSVPALSASLFTPISKEWDFEFGLGFLSMHREGTINTSGLSIQQEQDAYISSVRAGAAFSPWTLMGDKIKPYLSAAALPTMIVTKRSSFDDGINDLGVPFEVGAGVLAQVSKPIALRLGITETLGKVKSSDMKGFAAYLGIRVPI